MSKFAKENIFDLTLYQVIKDTDTQTESLYYGIDLGKAKDEYNDADSEYGWAISLQKKTDGYKFIGEIDTENEETIEDYPIEDYYEDKNVYKLVKEGEWDITEIKIIDPKNKKTDKILSDVENYYKKLYGNYKYNKIIVDNGKDEYDDDYKEYGRIMLRLSDHSENVRNIDKYGSCDYYISVVIANLDPTHGQFQVSMYERRRNEKEIYFNEDNDIDEIIESINEQIEEGRQYIYYKNNVSMKRGGIVYLGNILDMDVLDFLELKL